MLSVLLWALMGTGFTFLMTTLGSSMVFLFRGKGAVPSSASSWALPPE